MITIAFSVKIIIMGDHDSCSRFNDRDHEFNEYFLRFNDFNDFCNEFNGFINLQRF